MKFFSDRRRPVDLGPYPLERLRRVAGLPAGAPPSRLPAPRFSRPDTPQNIANAMRPYQAMMDALRDGKANPARADIPADLTARARHFKAFGYFHDASMMGICALPQTARLAAPHRDPDTLSQASELLAGQTASLAAGVDVVLADLRDHVRAPESALPESHAYAIVCLSAWPRDPRPDEPGVEWIADAQVERASLRASENAVVLAEYLRVLGYDARAHTPTARDVELEQLALHAGLATNEGGTLTAPFVGTRFGLAVVTTDLALASDAPLAPLDRQPAFARRHPRRGTAAADPYIGRDFAMGPHPFEKLRRVDVPTTYIDEPNVPRVPKRTDMFARGQFGDMGEKVQTAMKGGHHVTKTAPSAAQRRLLGALILLQDGPVAAQRHPIEPQQAADALKAASHFLGADAAGTSACPDWAWYSHDATGTPIEPPHDQALSLIVDQGYDTMEGASGDDWISAAQSMRAYLRFAILGGVLAGHLRALGHPAKAHTVMDGDVLQPPLLLLAGLGEVSRIGEVILNPYLGPRLKSGVVTTSLPLTHDKPIDFGLQRFCASCNKCARECPSGAITAGPKTMFNGYEIWKSDSQRCATYRITNQGGAMCGRCMKTCPWNLEGLFAEAPFRWAATHIPRAAPVLARLDDALGRGGLNPVKTWWWDLEKKAEGGFRLPDAPVNRRNLSPDLKLAAKDQTLAVYPAPLAPHPWPFPDPMDREAAIRAHVNLVDASTHRAKLQRGETDHLHRYSPPADRPVLDLRIDRVCQLGGGVTLFDLRAADGSPLPAWEAGAHLDIVVAPEFLRPYSLTGDPADRHRYRIAVLRETAGRGGSDLAHRIFTPGRRIFAARPANHFPLEEAAPFSLLLGGGIGITPMIAFAHRLHALGRGFALHYSAPTRERAGFADYLAATDWHKAIYLHLSDEGSRLDANRLLANLPHGSHVYICGPETYMADMLRAAADAGLPEANIHREYFAAPTVPDRPNHPFTLRLASGRMVEVAQNQSAAEALVRAGIPVPLKCSDGICGVCQCGLRGGAVDHRDHVLSQAQRKERIILCQSRAAEPGGIVEIDL
ncbi:MAG: NAD-binding oxidoreductase [Rhodobacteraceae bacterium]|nr:NAD-binding oxidoreductase [Paracoccaceae bacterium]